MTQTIAKKVAKLTKTSSKHMARVSKNGDDVFVTSAAKYYPALKKLASK